jgi:hypothetical protein
MTPSLPLSGNSARFMPRLMPLRHRISKKRNTNSPTEK